MRLQDHAETKPVSIRNLLRRNKSVINSIYCLNVEKFVRFAWHTYYLPLVSTDCNGDEHLAYTRVRGLGAKYYYE